MLVIINLSFTNLLPVVVDGQNTVGILATQNGGLAGQNERNGKGLRGLKRKV